MADQMTVQAGTDATRLDLDETAVQERRRKQAAARGNLAALMCERYGVDPTVEPHPTSLDEKYAAAEFADLTSILGLAPAQPHTRGLCKQCGGDRPMYAHTGAGGYRPGLCWWCSRGIPRPADAAPAVQRRTGQPDQPLAPSDYRGGTGHCPECDRAYHLTGEGHLRPHPGWENRGGVQVRLSTPCPGSGELSRELADLAALTKAAVS